MDENDNIPLIVLFAWIVLIIVGTPFATVWSLNILFGLKIPFTMKTWAASSFLLLIFIWIRKMKEED